MKKHKVVINISPLCDVCFTVLMTLMVTVPIMAISGKYKPKLPSAHTIEQERTEGSLCVTVVPHTDEITGKQGLAIAIGERDCGVFTGEEGDTVLDVALRLLKEKIQENKERPVLIRADRMVRHGLVLDLLRTAKVYGGEHISIATMQRGGGI
jgi:biopolymer transport protein ExbD